MPEPQNGGESAEGALTDPTTGQPAAAGTSKGEPSDAGKGIGGNDEKWEKRFGDLQGQLSRMQSEKDKLSGALEQLTKQSMNAAPKGPTEDELRREREAFIASLDENLDGKTIVELLDKAVLQGASLAEQKLQAKIQQVEESLSGVTARLGDYDPEWRKAAPIVEEFGLREKLGSNADRDTLIKVANILSAAKGPAQPADAVIPGSTGGQAVVGQGEGVTDADVQNTCRQLGLDYKKLTPANIAELKRKWSSK